MTLCQKCISEIESKRDKSEMVQLCENCVITDAVDYMLDKNEKVDHPNHYKGKTLESIDVIEDFDLNFRLGNAIKYILRAGKKESMIQDLKKAKWYIEREIMTLEKK